MAKTDLEKTVQKITDDLVQKLGADVGVEVVKDKDNEAIKVNLMSDEDAGILIGRKGENLFALQSVIGMIVKNQTGDWARIVLDINDWRAKEQDNLEQLAEETAERAVETGETQRLYNLTPSQRRIVHMKLSENKDITTESSGEDADRYLEVIPNTK